MSGSSAQPAPPELRLAVQQFNAGAYFACHETLEPLWRRARGPRRDLCQGVIQFAVALHHLGRGNRTGAATLLAKAIDHLEHAQGVTTPVDVPGLIREVRRTQGRLRAQDDASPAPRIRLR